MRSILFSLLLTTHLCSVLPPAWQGVAELKALVNSEELSNYLNSADVIQNLSKTESGWLITTNHSQILVDVVTEHQAFPGPQKFSLRFSKLPTSSQ